LFRKIPDRPEEEKFTIFPGKAVKFSYLKIEAVCLHSPCVDRTPLFVSGFIEIHLQSRDIASLETWALAWHGQKGALAPLPL